MSALARYFHNRGVRVSGYDKTSTPLTKALQQKGIDIHYDDNPQLIASSPDLVIYTPAVPRELKEYVYLEKLGIPVRKRAEVLGELSRNYQTIAVAGTHGKTTVSTLSAHILYQSSIQCKAFLGGISKNYDTNLLESEKAGWLVVEADEFDRSFLQLRPATAIITSMDADHLDIYNDHQTMKDNFSRFAGQVNSGGNLILKKGLDLPPPANVKVFNYALSEKADYFAENIALSGLFYSFDIHTPGGTIKNCRLGVPGLINVENAIAATASAQLAGATDDDIRKNLESFKGIKRRFDIRVHRDNMVYIDDYAHHPEEIRGLLYSLKDIFPGQKILGIFQPHLYSRTRDFAKAFSDSLSMLEEVILLPIYPAREKPIEGVDSAMLLNQIRSAKKYLVKKNQIPEILKNHDFDILLTIGAGDIDQLVEPIENYLLTHKQPVKQ
ncbi:MAG: UDP-N-acetylmuramate--L-alanine ligase [Bacteroidetes bacterium]|nr:UDP-N-acetylmuramate--L-alanine ligase [Bacteroidota bacterium]